MRLANQSPRWGMTTTELLISLVCLVIVIAVVSFLLVAPQRIDQRVMRETFALKGIHQSFLVAAREHDGAFPLPSVIAGSADEIVNRHDTTAALYSYMIMENYFPPDLVVSARETNPRVRVHQSFGWELYDPLQQVFWDDSFQADLHQRSHTSFAHMYLHGERVNQYWRETLNSSVPIFSSRGPMGGQRIVDSYTTNERGEWSGVVVNLDISVDRIHTMTPDGLTYGPDQKQDNLFAIDDGEDGVDVVLTFTHRTSEGQAQVHHD